jgi:hypothetical protein
MTDQWLNSTNKFMIFFGGFNCIDPLLEEEDARIAEEKDSSEPKVRYVQDLCEPIGDLRNKIVQALCARADIEHVEDLFDVSVDEFFDPIIFTLRIPKSLLTAKRHHHEDSASVSEFTIVYDGRILMVVVLVPIHKWPYGIHRVRLKFEEIMKGICNFEIVAPCVTHEALTIVNDVARDSNGYNDLYLPILTGYDRHAHIQHVYADLSSQLRRFYSACHFRTEGAKATYEITELQKEFIETTRTFMKTEWYNILSRRKTVRELRSKCIDIFAKISEYLSTIQELNEEISDIREQMAVTLCLNNC